MCLCVYMYVWVRIIIILKNNCLTRINPISPALFTVACPQHRLFAELPPLGKLTGLFLHIRSEWTTGCTTPTYLTDFTACRYRSPLQ